MKQIPRRNNMQHCIPLLTGIAVLLSLFSCNKVEQEPVQQEGYYKWRLEDAAQSHLHPLYYDESYFLIPTELEERMVSLTRIDEKYGDTIYTVELGQVVHLPGNASSKMWESNGELFIIIDRLLCVVDIESGALIRRHTYPNFLWESSVGEEYIYTCFFSADDEFNYAKIDISTGAMTLLHSEKQGIGDNFISGHAPVETPHGPVFPFSIGNTSQGVYENYIIWPTPEKDSLIQLDWTEKSIGGPVFDDETTIYLFMMDQMLAYRKSDLSLKWKMKPEIIAFGRYYQTEDKIYFVPTPEVALMFIINKSDGSYKTVDSPACRGKIERIGDYLYFVGWGDFKEFNMLTEEFSQKEGAPYENSGYLSTFGISPNSKLLWTHRNDWKCFPMDQ